MPYLSLLFASHLIAAQPPVSGASPSQSSQVGENPKDRPTFNWKNNGINVGAVKVFDENSLARMLATVEGSIRNRSVLDVNALAAAIGRLQGATSSSTSLAASVTTLPLPSLTTGNTTVTTDSTKLTDVQGSNKSLTNEELDSAVGTATKQKTTASATPNVPTLPALPSSLSLSQPFGAAPQDLLFQQVSLQYQLMNLSLLLEQAVSDRYLYVDEKPHPKDEPVKVAVKRGQSVLGFQISLDPGTKYKNRVAEVEILLNRSGADRAFLTRIKNLLTGDYTLDRLLDHGRITEADRGRVRYAVRNDQPEWLDSLSDDGRVELIEEIAQREDVQNRAKAETPSAATESKSTQLTFLDPEGKVPGSVSLIGQYPRADSYNVATVKRGSKAFGLGGIASVLNVGVSASKSDEQLFLVQDTDTIAVERPVFGDVGTKDPDRVRFAWQFRPVLKQGAVVPGLRQVYAHVALPVSDGADFVGYATIRTRWRYYDRDSKTVGGVVPGSETDTVRENVVVSRIAPTVTKAMWTDQRDGTIRVDLEGKNLVPETLLGVGARRYSVGSGLFAEGDRRLSAVVPAQALFDNKTLLVGRNLEQNFVLRLDQPESSGSESSKLPLLSFHGGIVSKGSDGKSTLRVLIGVENSAKLKSYGPILLRVGNRILGLADVPGLVDSSPKDQIDLDQQHHLESVTYEVPSTYLEGAVSLDARYLYWSPLYTSRVVLAPDDSDKAKPAVKSAALQARGTTESTIAISGLNLPSEAVTVVVSGTAVPPSAFSVRSKKLLVFNVPNALSDDCRSVVVVVGSEAFTVSLGRGSLAEPDVDLGTFAVGDQTERSIKGKNLDSVSRVTFVGTPIAFQVEGEGTVLRITPNESMTKSVGKKELELLLKDGRLLRRTFSVVANQP